jgi:hypothetical protein
MTEQDEGTNMDVAAIGREGSKVTRRQLLRGVGIGAGAVLVAAAGGIAWRVVDQSVLDPWSGPAYEPWSADLDGSAPESLVAAAILAANAHNTQPWLFRVTTDAIDVHADHSRSMGTMDPLGRERTLSLGCALENLVLAARAHGLAPDVLLMPDGAAADRVAVVSLRPGVTDRSALFRAIPTRHTDRSAYDTRRALDPAVLAAVAGRADDPVAAIAWVTEPPDMARFGRMTVDATAAILADSEQSADDYRWYRQDRHEIDRQRDGITMDAGGLDEPARLLVRLLPGSQAQMQQGWLDATRDRHVATAGSYGLVHVDDPLDPVQLLQAGRLFQRTHLGATVAGLAVQPLNQVLERADRERTCDCGTSAIDGLTDLTPGGRTTVMAFRIGHPTRRPGLSPRRPVADVTRG